MRTTGGIYASVYLSVFFFGRKKCISNLMRKTDGKGFYSGGKSASASVWGQQVGRVFFGGKNTAASVYIFGSTNVSSSPRLRHAARYALRLVAFSYCVWQLLGRHAPEGEGKGLGAFPFMRRALMTAAHVLHECALNGQDGAWGWGIKLNAETLICCPRLSWHN